MLGFEFYSVDFTKFEKSNCFLERDTIRIIDIGPYTFNILELDILVKVGLILGFITSSEMIIILTLPDCEYSITHGSIIIRIVFGQSCKEIPRSILTIK